MGSAFGPILVGFFLLDNVSMYYALTLMGLIEVLLGILFFPLSWRLKSAFALALVVGLLPLLEKSKGMLEVLINLQHSPIAKVTNVIENRHGVIYTVHDDLHDVDLVYGGNVYDGAFSVDLVSNVNGISRAYLLAGLHPKPKKVLFIGLSSGSWLKVVSSFPDVDLIDVVEINPGYKDLLTRYPGGRRLLSDERINIFYTDGRKWLEGALSKGEKYDLIVMNNTWHWRAYSTNLLSYEFMSMLRSSISPGGVVTFNTTGSLDVLYTASQIFSGAYWHRGFIYASDHNLNNTYARISSRLCELNFKVLEGQGCQNESFRLAVDKLKNFKFLSREEVPKYQLLGRQPELIRDDNMIVEYKYGRGLDFY